jgi:glutamate carboxypeptidase
MNCLHDTWQWIDDQRDVMTQRLMAWSAINTGSFNWTGIENLMREILPHFRALDASVEQIQLPPYEIVGHRGELLTVPLSSALVISRRPTAPMHVLLVVHLDTVYGPESPFQQSERLDENTLRGPGVADAKGGLAVMLTALEAVERTGKAEGLGWKVILNPDEEVGSPGSAALLKRSARHANIGLVFEPALPDGSLISKRKGSGNFTVVVRGQGAHFGRDPEKGRNAIHALAEMIITVTALADTIAGVDVNVGRIEGGGPVNIVPDLAIAHLNIRVDSTESERFVTDRIYRIVQRLGNSSGVRAALYGGFHAPPKPLDDRVLRLLKHLARCGQEIGLDLHWHPSGGVCDGNQLAASGLPTVDTLGPCGGDLHSPNEYVLIDSLTQRAKLTATLLLRYAAGELCLPRPQATA